MLIAYYYAREQYNIIQELPAGEGFADIVFIPKPFVNANAYPPMVVELKWNKTADSAIAQIKNKKYPYAFIVCVEDSGFGASVAGPVANSVLQYIVYG